MPLRAIIVDDNAEFLQVASKLLQQDGITVESIVPTSAEALRLVRELRPDVVLVDIDLGRESGFDLTRRLHNETGVKPGVILISTHDEDDYAELVADSPALGFLPKSALSGRAIQAMLGVDLDPD